MLCRNKNSIFNFIANLVTAAAITSCVLPGFELLGDIIEQVFATAACTLITLLAADIILKRDPKIFADSLIVMTLFWVTFAICKQLDLHIFSKNYSLKWFHIFYYDRPAMLFVVFAVCILYFVFKLIFNCSNNDFIKKYSVFMKKTTISLLIYYLIILIYCFVITRRVTAVRPDVNLKPFDTIVTTFSLGYVDYELLFLFLGNIAVFFPLGVFIFAFTKNKIIIAISPLIVSVGIELSQFFLGNGHPDIDDVILNVIGFYLGALTKVLLDKLIFKASKGKIESIFIFSK